MRIKSFRQKLNALLNSCFAADSRNRVGDDTPQISYKRSTEFFTNESVIENPIDKPKKRDLWFFPQELAMNLSEAKLPQSVVEEVLACAWEYTSCVIPHFTNWSRLTAYFQLVVIAAIAEFRGELVDIATTDLILGHDIKALLDTLFAGTAGHEDMMREYRCFLLITAEKSDNRNGSEIFRRYVKAVAQSAKQWFRMRDCDALCRFTIAASLACNDFDDFWFTDEEWDMIAELGDTMYDAVAFHKHLAEGEINNTFAYAGAEVRQESYRNCREALWALDSAWAKSPPLQCVVNFLRPYGGPIHMTMRRYRFVEDGLTIGSPANKGVVAQTRSDFKLWHRVEEVKKKEVDVPKYLKVLLRSDTLMFPGLHEMLQESDGNICERCVYPGPPKVLKTRSRFGGVQLCRHCQGEWQAYLKAFPSRLAQIFPAVRGVGFEA